MKLHLFTKEQLETMEAVLETSNMAARSFYLFCEEVKTYSSIIKNRLYIYDMANEGGLLTMPDDDCTTLTDAVIRVFDYIQDNNEAKRLLETSHIVYGFPYSRNGQAIVFALGGEINASKQIDAMRERLKATFLNMLIDEYQELQVKCRELEETVKKLS